ncbi:MAG: N-acetylmuramoyl-L-alanine amidase [Marinibacterium sp.]
MPSTHPTAIPHLSPNFGPRRGGARPDLIVLHYTAMASVRAALDRLCDPGAEVSAHYLIGERGRIWQLVDEDMRAWHAGAGRWHDVTDVNSRSIGIELANPGNHPFPAPQMTALEDLLRGILTRHRIRPDGVIGHSDMAPGRKSDPGPRFDWARLDRQGLSAPPRARAPADLSDFRRLAARAGYTADAPDSAVLAAVRLRLRPWARGGLSPDDLSALCRP